MSQLLEQYIQALQDHRTEFWADIRDAIYRELIRGSHEYLR